MINRFVICSITAVIFFHSFPDSLQAKNSYVTHILRTMDSSSPAGLILQTLRLFCGFFAHLPARGVSRKTSSCWWTLCLIVPQVRPWRNYIFHSDIALTPPLIFTIWNLQNLASIFYTTCHWAVRVSKWEKICEIESKPFLDHRWWLCVLWYYSLVHAPVRAVLR